jgi:hypothetical protein
MRLWSLAGAMHAPFFAGNAAGGFLGSLVPIAAWLNPHLTTGYAVEVSKYLNIQPRGMGSMLASMVRSGLTMEEARAVLRGLYNWPILKNDIRLFCEGSCLRAAA